MGYARRRRRFVSRVASHPSIQPTEQVARKAAAVTAHTSTATGEAEMSQGP
jgi:hypothetical protein